MTGAVTAVVVRAGAAAALDLQAQRFARSKHPHRGVTAGNAGGGREVFDLHPVELDCAQRLGTSGLVVHSVPWALCCALRHVDAPMDAVRMAIRHGGDTDTNAAMVGAWLGARHGPEAFPRALVDALAGGPFGVAHAQRLVAAVGASPAHVPGYAWPLALLRNVALFPVVLAHGFRRLLPW